MTVRLYVGSPLSVCPPLCRGRTAPEVSEEEGSYASRFYRWFLESFKSCLLLLVALPGLIDTLAQLLAWRSLLWLSMAWRQRYVIQSNLISSAQHRWPDLWHYSYCFGSVMRSLYGGSKYTHTRTYTHTHTQMHRYTYTYTYTHIYTHTHSLTIL